MYLFCCVQSYPSRARRNQNAWQIPQELVLKGEGALIMKCQCNEHTVCRPECYVIPFNPYDSALVREVVWY